MCEITNQIKLCTCVDENIEIENLNHYWVLHRKNNNKSIDIMGIPVFPDHLHPRYEVNADILLKTLNTPDTFDEKITLNSEDCIEIILCNNKETNELFRYTYRYTGKSWVTDDSDCFDLINNYEEVYTGELKEI